MSTSTLPRAPGSMDPEDVPINMRPCIPTHHHDVRQDVEATQHQQCSSGHGQYSVVRASSQHAVNAAPSVPVDVVDQLSTAGAADDDGEQGPVQYQQARRISLKKDFCQIAREIDEEFLKASAGGADVARTLETTCYSQAINVDLLSKGKLRLHPALHHITYNIMYSCCLLMAIALYFLQLGGMSAKMKEEALVEKKASHALTLERLAAWERKLFQEVKVVEALRAEQQKKCSLLKRQEMRAAAEDAAAGDIIERTLGEVKRLQSLILVCGHAVDSTLEAIEDLRDDELHPQLVELIAGLMNVWMAMQRSHGRQSQIIVHIKSVEASTDRPTSQSHHEATIQLEKELLGWHESFRKLVAAQRGYISALYGWIKLSFIPIDLHRTAQCLQEKHSTGRAAGAEEYEREHDHVLQETYRLCEEWQRALVCLPDRVATEAIKSLAEVVKAMVAMQGEEMKQRRKAEKLEKKWEKKMRALQPHLELEEEAWAEEARGRRRRRMRRLLRGLEEEEEEEGAAEGTTSMLLMERKAVVGGMRKRLEGETMKHSRAVQDTRVMSMNNLPTGLPGVLEAMTAFSAVCSHAFQDLFSLTGP
ncbi:hypothetical protein L7F22_067688 [Adiantum nelumboides]|nr:hypothetical protein [Adiantum nelumboides]